MNWGRGCPGSAASRRGPVSHAVPVQLAGQRRPGPMLQGMAIVVFLIVSGAAHAGLIPKLPAVPLSHIPTELSPLDPGGVLDGVVVYLCDREPYGSFFFETARVQGTMVLADSLTSRFGRALAEAAAQAYEVPQSDPEQWPNLVKRVARNPETRPDALASLRQQGARLEMMIGPIVGAGERAPHLLSQIPSLTQGAPGDFSGLRGKLKLARVVGSLKGSAGQLHDAGSGSIRTLKNIRAIVSALGS